MAIQNEPTRIQIPFADSGTKNVIPNTNSTPSASQAASWTDGFPAQCSLPLSAGGIPPARADFNGIFNTMTQSIRFGQEGGVWAWDATVDYAANRVVLGSDGLLYWSVAQSGPNVGGAQNPTADTTSTYWSTMPMLTPGLGDKSNKAATTEWVKDLAVAELYVDASVASSGDGYSSSTAFKTIGEAVSAAKAKPGRYTKIFIAGNTYTEDISIDHLFVLFVLEGNTTINGKLYVYNSSVVGLNSSNGSSLTLNYTGDGSNLNNSAFIIRDNTHVNIEVNLNIICNSACSDCLTLVSSSLYSLNDILCTVNGTISRVFSATNGSIVSIGGDIGITTTANVDYFIYVSRCSSFVLNNGALAFQAPNMTYGVFCEQTAAVVLVDYAFNLTAKDCIVARFNSAICFYNSNSELWCSGWHNFDCGWNSCIYINSSSIKANSNAPSESSVFVHSHSGFDIGGGSLVVNGSFGDGILLCSDASSLQIQGDCTYSGSPTGPKWSVYNCSVINVASRVLSNLPGNQSGNTYPNSFGFIN